VDVASFWFRKSSGFEWWFSKAEKLGILPILEKKFLKKLLFCGKLVLPTSTLEEVEKEIAENSATVIDVRDAYRYRGESEPIDLVAGHIPGAINIPFSENLDENGEFLSPEILKEKYQKLLADVSTPLNMTKNSSFTVVLELQLVIPFWL
jgi:thiosulfate/3-mercaptopyruvate sulfurtransferase